MKLTLKNKNGLPLTLFFLFFFLIHFFIRLGLCLIFLSIFVMIKCLNSFFVFPFLSAPTLIGCQKYSLCLIFFFKGQKSVSGEILTWDPFCHVGSCSKIPFPSHGTKCTPIFIYVTLYQAIVAHSQGGDRKPTVIRSINGRNKLPHTLFFRAIIT